MQTDPGLTAPPAEIEDIKVDGGPTGSVRVRIVRPAGADGALPAILYVHGLGWIFGGPVTHDRLVRELAAGTGAAVVFHDYDLAPEAKYPTQIEQVYAVAEWVAASGADYRLDSSRIAVAGDSVGGNMATVATILAKQRGGVQFAGQLLYYPVTNASFDTGSYQQFATGYFLARDGMQWFWDQYTTDPAERAEITASPLPATADDLAGLPQALVIVAEADVLRDEGEAYAAKLRGAGVPVTTPGHRTLRRRAAPLAATPPSAPRVHHRRHRPPQTPDSEPAQREQAIRCGCTCAADYLTGPVATFIAHPSRPTRTPLQAAMGLLAQSPMQPGPPEPSHAPHQQKLSTQPTWVLGADSRTVKPLCTLLTCRYVPAAGS